MSKRDSATGRFVSDGDTLEESFWMKVDRRGPNECWEWQGATSTSGYGSFRMRRKIMLAHRAAWIFMKGPIPAGAGYHGICVLHRCDNRRCCNPNHLFLGTHADNMADRNAKDRQAKGERVTHRGEDHGKSKVTMKQVVAIRKDHRPETVLAKLYGISRTEIGRIRRRERWGWLKEIST